MTAKNKRIIIFEKDAKARRIMDIMCRKAGYSDIIEVESMKTFNKVLANHVDKASGMFGLVGKSALPRLEVGLFIIDWDSAPKGVTKLIRELKSKYSGKYRFMVVAESQHADKASVTLGKGVSGVMIKPFKQADFSEKLGEVLSGKEPLMVKDFNLSAAAQQSNNAGYGINPFAMGKEKEKTKPDITPKKTVVNAPAMRSEPKTKTAEKPVAKPKPVVRPAAGAGSRHSFYNRSSQPVRRSETPTATLVDGKIDGHYHEKVDVIGGGENCYWAKEAENDAVRLEYLSAKGLPTGVEAKVMEKEDFMYNFFLCEEHGCGILKRLGKFPVEK